MADQLKLYRVWGRGVLANGGSGEISKLVYALDEEGAFEVFKDVVDKMELPHTFVWRREDATVTTCPGGLTDENRKLDFISFDAPFTQPDERREKLTFRCSWGGMARVVKAHSEYGAAAEFMQIMQREHNTAPRFEDIQIDEIDAAMQPDPDECGYVSLYVELPGLPRLDITAHDTEDNPRQCLVLIQDMIGKLLGPQAMHVMPNLTAADAMRVQADMNRVSRK